MAIPGQLFHIQYGAHTCKLSANPPKDIEAELRKMMAYEPKEQSFVGNYKGFKVEDKNRYLYNRNSREFPTGLLPKVIERFGALAVTGREPPLKTSEFSTSLPPRHYQQTAFDILTRLGRGVAVIPTGCGKTLNAAMLAAAYPDTTVIITTPNKRLLKQNREEVSKFLGVEVGILGDKERELNHRIIVATIQSIASRIEANDQEVFNLLTKTGVWICDECHGAAADSYRLLSRYLPNAHTRFGLTATWVREDGCELIMEGILGDVVYEYSYDEAFAEGYLTPIRVWLREFDHLKLQGQKRKPAYGESYKHRISENDLRNLQVMLDAAALVDTGLTPCLVMVRYIPHGQLLANYLGCPFINGDHSTKDVDKVLDDFMAGKHLIIVASSILNVGVNLKPLRSAINAAAGDSRIDALQKPGRGLRLFDGKEYFDYVDYYDREDNYFRNHAANRKTVYKLNFPGKVIQTPRWSGLVEYLENGAKPLKFMEDI